MKWLLGEMTIGEMTMNQTFAKRFDEMRNMEITRIRRKYY